MDNAHSGSKWPYLIAGGTGVFVIASVASMVFAFHRVSKVVDASYYADGLHYGAKADRLERGMHLGWHFSVSSDRENVRVAVTDRAGHPVPGGTLRTARDGGRDFTATPFSEEAPGLFQTPLAALSGRNRASRLLFTNGDAAVEGRLVLVP